ncbi:hypothetical protein D5086_006372 [Populus alba]|uniref:Uncharacterized protein n=1 Tax=Populus alba TaxID=43335 RepID=A0ACC4CKC8_POPAL
MAALSEAGVLEVGATSGGGCRFVDSAVVAGALDVANGCGLEAESQCSAVRGDAGAEGEGFGLMEMKRLVKEKQAAGERAERRGTTLVSVRHGAELGLLKLWCSWRLVWLLLGWRGCTSWRRCWR